MLKLKKNPRKINFYNHKQKWQLGEQYFNANIVKSGLKAILFFF